MNKQNNSYTVISNFNLFQPEQSAQILRQMIGKNQQNAVNLPQTALRKNPSQSSASAYSQQALSQRPSQPGSKGLSGSVITQNTMDNSSNYQEKSRMSNKLTPSSSQARVYSPDSKQRGSPSKKTFSPSLQHSESKPQRESNQNFKVVVRVRPAIKNEMRPHLPFMPVVNVTPDSRACVVSEYLGSEISDQNRQMDMLENPHLVTNHSFAFDHVYGPESTQEQVYGHTAKEQVISVLEGYNATILAYGQTGSGKTFSMEGFKYTQNDPQRGIIPRSMEEIFKYIQTQSNRETTFMVRASYLQIYNENISDLLKTDRSFLSIREDKRKGVFVEGLSEWAVRSPSEIFSLMERGAAVRATAATKKNDVSSRSHAVFIMIVEQMTYYDQETQARMKPGSNIIKQIKVGKLNLVDLAGSERVRVTGATGKRLEECKSINQSLSALMSVIQALTDKKKRTHVPYRDSKLTRLLEDSLGGNCKTTMMATVSPSYDSYLESLCTLKFATRAKKVKNEAKINEDVDQRALLRKYEIELKKLRAELEEKNKVVHDKEEYLQLAHEKQQAEVDKMAAIRALEHRSMEFMKEKENKKMLEEKIKMLNSQLLIGGKKIEDLPQFKSALEEKQKIIREEYEGKLQEIEKERTQIEEDKAQVDRYKQLLLKQRDIMIALTARLNERDETIIQLQEELDAYERIHRETEQMMDMKEERALQLQYLLTQHKIAIPEELQVEGNFGQHRSRAQSHGQEERKFPPHETLHFQNEEDDVPLQLLTPSEKVEELQHLLRQREFTIQDMEKQLSMSLTPQTMQPQIDQMVQNEVEKRLKTLQKVDTNKGHAEQRLKMSEDRNEALTSLLKQKDQDLDKTVHHRNTLSALFESDLTNMANKIQQGLQQVRTENDLRNLSIETQNLLKLIQVSFQALKKNPPK